jgi:hypothetical protein
VVFAAVNQRANERVFVVIAVVVFFAAFATMGEQAHHGLLIISIAFVILLTIGQ